MSLKRNFILCMLCLSGALSVVAFVSSNMFDAAYFDAALCRRGREAMEYHIRKGEKT